VKHMTVELEEKVRGQIAFLDERLHDYLEVRLALIGDDGIPPKCEANELEAAGWKRALKWVLSEAGCA